MPESRFSLLNANIGPDIRNDIRKLRSYFLVPITTSVSYSESNSVGERVRCYVNARQPTSQITDVIIFSHGWHRKIWDAISAYDRVASRLSRLLHQGPITPPRNRPYVPLYLNVYWHSEVGNNEWVNLSKRRRRESFIFNCRQMFMDDRTAFVQYFDQVYDLFTDMSENGDSALNEPELNDRAEKLQTELWQFPLRNGSGLDEDRISAMWECYYNAEQLDRVDKHEEEPHRFLGVQRALFITLEFLAKAMGARLALIVLLLIILFQHNTVGAWNSAVSLASKLPLLDKNHSPIDVLLVLLPLVAIICLIVEAVLHRCSRNNKGVITPIGALLLLYLQFLVTLPLIVWLSITFLTRKYWPICCYDERIGFRNSAPWGGFWRSTNRVSISWALSWLARSPSLIVERMLPRGYSLGSLLTGFSSQLSFWEMQRKAVVIGKENAAFISQLYTNCPQLRNARLHLIGHSFGGLVMANTARHLAYDQSFDSSIDSLCLLQGAISSDWFEKEEQTIQQITETLICVYSRYDTANMFYFPFANNGKYSAGYVGLCGQFGIEIEQVIAPTALSTPMYFNLDEPPLRKRLINYDASRLISEGPASFGGSHSDVFTDQVLYVIWAATVGASFRETTP